MYFITGTDTGVGKTWATLALMRAMQNQGRVVVGMKPVASGCIKTKQGLQNNDALRILQQSSPLPGQSLDYSAVNPYAFEAPVAPHIAAGLAGVKIDIEKIVDEFKRLNEATDCVVVEGVGGWNVPLGTDSMLADIVGRLDLKVILIVGLRLGCINHALSAVRSIEADGAELHGWITSQLDPGYLCLNETLDSLRRHINAPFLGDLPHMRTFDIKRAAASIEI